MKVTIYEIDCETPEELAAIRQGLQDGSPTTEKRIHPNQAAGTTGSWKRAEEFARKHNIGKNDARSLLTKARKEGVDPVKLLKSR